ncbi:MAG TPA: hypothetical protein VIK00_02965, partial [Candidatus Limnocylindrales bacterium]
IFTLPEARWAGHWRIVLDTKSPEPPELAPASSVLSLLPEAALANAADMPPEDYHPQGEVFHAGSQIELIGRSLVVLERVSA